jgi:peptidoglycan/LPS O-acetylase OafA/YrhL
LVLTWTVFVNPLNPKLFLLPSQLDSLFVNYDDSLLRNSRVVTALAGQSSGLPFELASAISQKHIPCIDAIRAIAVLLVVLFHFGVPGASGSLGVVIFFVLSGFLITWLLLQEEAKTGGISLVNFYRRRSLRIFPAFYVYLAVNFAVMHLAARTVSKAQLISAAVYVSNYYLPSQGICLNGLGHTWSLSVEEQFYLIWPVVFFWIGKTRGRRLYFLAGTISVIWIYRIVAVYILRLNQVYVFEAFETRADHILVGCFLAVMLWEGRGLAFWKWLCVSGWRSCLLGLALAVSVGAHAFVSSAIRDTVFQSLEPVLIAAAFVGLLSCSRTGLVSWTANPIVRFLGTISYSVYLYQQCAADLNLFGSLPRLVAIPGALLVIIALASVSYYLIERPCLNLKKHFNYGATLTHLAKAE